MTDAVERAYDEALRLVVRPGAVVLDLGGDVARRAVMACRFGAARVYSVQSAWSLPAANAMALANGCNAAIRRIDTLSTVPPAVDIVVARLPGALPLHGLSLLADPLVRDRLAAAATPIPRRECLSMALVDAPAMYFGHAGVWDVGHDLNLAPARQLALNTWSSGRVEAGQLLVEPREWATCEYAGATDAMAGQAEWTIGKAGVAHGIAVWPAVTFAEGIVLPNAPGVSDVPLGHAFFPWLEPVHLIEDDRVSVTIRADALGTGNVWTWTSSVQRGGREPIVFRQSTFMSRLQLPGR